MRKFLKKAYQIIGLEAKPSRSKSSYFSYGIEDVKFLGVSKIGNLSWKGSYLGNPVKIYTCFDKEQAKLIEWLSNNSSIQEYLPNCHFTWDNIVVCDWVIGSKISSEDIINKHDVNRQIFDFLNKIHSMDISSLSVKNNLYIESIYKRLKNFDVLNKFDFNIEYDFVFDENSCLSHPDVTANNIILTKQGIVIIDNEFLSVSSYPKIDYLNLINSFSDKVALKSDFFIDLDEEDLNYLEDVWKMRMVGSLLQKGAYNKATDFYLLESSINYLLKGHKNV